MFSKLKIKKLPTGLYELKEDLTFNDVVVPKGYVTDLATTPEWIHWLYPPLNKHYIKSSIIHDYIYDFSDFSRVKCDWLFLKAMKCEGFDFVGRWNFYFSVRLFGGRYR